MVEFVNNSDQEQQVKKLKRFLEGWRMALLPLKSIILWEQQWHPCAIVGSVSLFFFLIWIMDLNSLATFAVFGLFFNFIDFIVPIVSNSLYGPSAWTGQHEKLYEEICKSIVANYNKAWYNIHAYYSMRETSPCMARTPCRSSSTPIYTLWVSMLRIVREGSLYWKEPADETEHQQWQDCPFHNCDISSKIPQCLKTKYYIISISMLCILAWVASSVNNIFLLYVLFIVMLLWPGVQHRGIFNILLSMVNMGPKMSSLKKE